MLLACHINRFMLHIYVGLIIFVNKTITYDDNCL